MSGTGNIAGLWVVFTLACAPARAIAQHVRDRASTAKESSSATDKSKSISWRYRYHNGRWWYWLPSNSWAVYDNGRWTAYDATAYRRSSRSIDRYQGVWQESDDNLRWPRGENGSSPYASSKPGGAAFAPRDRGGLPPPGRWPRGNNGSNPYSSPEPGGAASRPNYNLPPLGRWPRINNGSDPYASPEPGGAAR